MTDVAHGPNTSVFEQQQHEEAAKKPLLGKNGEKFGKKLGNAAIFGAVSRTGTWRVEVGGANDRDRARLLVGRLSMGFFECGEVRCSAIFSFPFSFLFL